MLITRQDAEQWIGKPVELNLVCEDDGTGETLAYLGVITFVDDTRLAVDGDDPDGAYTIKLSEIQSIEPWTSNDPIDQARRRESLDAASRYLTR